MKMEGVSNTEEVQECGRRIQRGEGRKKQFGWAMSEGE